MAFDSTDDLVRHINAQHAEVLDLTKAEAAKTNGRLAEMSERLLCLEQAATTPLHASHAAVQSGGWIGAQVVNSAGYQNFLAANLSGKSSIRIENVSTAAGSAGPLIAPDRQSDVVLLPRMRPTVRSLLAPGRTNSDLVQFPRQTGFTNNAAVVTEGQTKPQSDITYELAEAPVRTIAHWIPVTKQAMSDAPQLQSLIDSDLRYGLALAEEQQLLFGTGLGEDLEGLTIFAQTYNPPFTVTGQTMLDDLLLGIAQAQQARYPATAIVVNDLDWARMQSIKDANGQYIGAGPFGSQLKLAWQVPVVDTPNMPEGSFMVGAFGLAAQILDRWDVQVLIADQHEDFFVKNMLAVLAEQRLALAVKRPEALVFGPYSA